MHHRFKKAFRWLQAPNPTHPLQDTEGGTNVSARFSHYIRRCIVSFYRRRMVFPIIYLILILLLFALLPMRSLLYPRETGADYRLSSLYQERARYVHIQLKDLHFTGYTRELAGLT